MLPAVLLAAHAWANLFHLDATGYSAPYYWGIIMCGLCWAITGIYLLKRLLLMYFSRAVAWLTLLCIVAGTHYFNYATLELGMSHVYSFTLFAAAALLTDGYYKKPTRGKAMLLGLILGWIVLIRPTNITILIFLLLYRVVSLNDLKARLSLLRRHAAHIALAIPFFVAICMPQLAYWKAMTGHWLQYSYANEKFIYWAQPKIGAVLFDTQNGLLLYSPILLFLFWGLVTKRKDPRANFWSVAALFIIITYIFASWWAWHFGGAFGHRCYIDFYPLLAFPLAVTMEQIVNSKKRYIKLFALFVVLLLCYYSVAMCELYMINGRYWEGAEWRWNYDGWWGLVRSIFGLHYGK